MSHHSQVMSPTAPRCCQDAEGSFIMTEWIDKAGEIETAWRFDWGTSKWLISSDIMISFKKDPQRKGWFLPKTDLPWSFKKKRSNQVNYTPFLGGGWKKIRPVVTSACLWRHLNRVLHLHQWLGHRNRWFLDDFGFVEHQISHAWVENASRHARNTVKR